MNTVYLLTGANEGCREEALQKAITEIDNEAGKVETASGIYETQPWGMDNGGKFLNQALKVSTRLSAYELIGIILQMENKMGRIRTDHYQNRTIDIDILFYNRIVINTPELTIPHPLIQERRFVLIPLAEIAPGFIHPVFGISVNEMLKRCRDPLSVALLI
ncbi:MAG: 2-amino-4-hydroxy-6-hydroxymethyldihydropteridine diphosphokinase [Bacteroidales bacterium]|nr:2-amino-4-hydroxy-6-hydroxymethyldihydropteridine diphosphokinase [Bacteroidales bacterium]